MEDRLISVNKLKAHYAWVRVTKSGQEWADTLDAIVDAQPTVEAEPIRHGKWIEIPDDGIYRAKCSVCGWKAGWDATDVSDEPYCPHCGARLLTTVESEEK